MHPLSYLQRVWRSLRRPDNGPEARRAFDISPTDDYSDDILGYYDLIFPGRAEATITPDEPDGVPAVSFRFLRGNESQPFHVVHTIGMSRPLLTLKALRPRSYDPGYDRSLVRHARAELMAFLPYDYPVPVRNAGNFDGIPEARRWPLQLMKHLTELPHRHSTWVGPGFLSSTESYVPYSDETKFCGYTLVNFEGNLGYIPLQDAPEIAIYTFVPLYKDEILYEQVHGPEKLMERVLHVSAGSFVINVDRPPAVEPWEYTGAEEE